MRQIFVDLDGVLANFDGHYEKLFGVKPDQDNYLPSELWGNIRAHGQFYRTIPEMPDAGRLWMGIRRFHEHPIILTGVPYSIPDVEKHKRAWIAEMIGSHVKVICCASKDKCEHGKPGDILIDDRLKYSKYWTDMGGVFLQHTSVSNTLWQLSQLVLPATT